MIRLDGKEVSTAIRSQIKSEAEAFLKKTQKRVGLAVIIVGNDAASQVYVRNKKRACEECGFYSVVHELPENVDEETLVSLIDTLNCDDSIHGILVQLPLPKHIHESRVVLQIHPDKDVDAFHPYNVGKFYLGDGYLYPCTPYGVMEILRYYNIPIAGKECVVVGRSNIVGKPQAMLLLRENGTVTICHSKTQNIAEITQKADILVSAVGKPHFIQPHMVKPGAVVVDVGINRTQDGKLVGDVDYEGISNIASYATPVPGGVGPMTITMLLKNTLTAALKSQEK